MWSFKDEEYILDAYIQGIKAVSELVMNNPLLLKGE